jgi:hypothetical protein
MLGLNNSQVPSADRNLTNEVDNISSANFGSRLPIAIGIFGGPERSSAYGLADQESGGTV